jgi:hypothetical protein
MVHRGKREYISLFSLQEDPEPDRVYPYAEVLDAFRRDGRLLLASKPRTRAMTSARGYGVDRRSINAPWVKKELDVAMNREIAMLLLVSGRSEHGMTPAVPISVRR